MRKYTPSDARLCSTRGEATTTVAGHEWYVASDSVKNTRSLRRLQQKSLQHHSTTEPFSTTGALKSFPSNCGPQLGAMPVKHLAHYPGTRESGLDQEALWSDLTERKEDGRYFTPRRWSAQSQKERERTSHPLPLSPILIPVLLNLKGRNKF